MLTSIRRQARGAKYRREAPGLHQRAFSGKPHSCCATTLHEGYIYHKTADGCKAGWTCAQHAPRRGEDSMGRLRIKTPDGCKGDWTCAKHAPAGRGAVGRRRVTYRYYNLTDGRWTRRDPIGIEGGVNLYFYSQNDPILRYDIKGESYVAAACCVAYIGLSMWSLYDNINSYTCAGKDGLDWLVCMGINIVNALLPESELIDYGCCVAQKNAEGSPEPFTECYKEQQENFLRALAQNVTLTCCAGGAGSIASSIMNFLRNMNTGNVPTLADSRCACKKQA